MELKYFRLIKTIAEEGNLSNSSEKLFLTQSALSHQLKELETRLGFKVFKRTRNQWKLTKEGKELNLIGKDILSRIEKGLKNIESLRAGSRGNIRLSTECYSFYQSIPSLIQKMGVLYPEIKIELVLEATHQPIQKIISNEIDIALVTRKTPNPLLRYSEIFEDEIYAIMHKECKLNQQKFIETNSFNDINLIIHSYPLETVSIYELLLKPNNCNPKTISAIPLTEVALEMVAANLGIFCLPIWALKPFKLSPNLVLKKISQNGLRRTHYIVTREVDAYKNYISDFISNFKEEILYNEFDLLI